MSKQRSNSFSGWAAVFSVAILAPASCRAPDGVGAAAESRTSALTGQGGGVTSTNLQLQVSKNVCTSNLAQDYFKITNSSSAAVPLSRIVIKYWINDTSAGTMAPSVAYGGCVISSNGSCVHPVSGVTATATRFSPACGTDASHQASWEIAISTTDTTPLSPGQTWSNLQTAVNLATYANFVPGTATWFSSCGTGKPYVADPSFAVYDSGDLVSSQGVQVPLCRAPAIVQIQTFIDQTFYATSDINSSFVSSQGEQIDCISFSAQRSVKAWLAAGVAMPQTVPALPAAPAGTPPPNVAPNLAFVGQPDVNGHPQQCPAGFVPTTRPTVAQIQAAGGLAAYQLALAHPPRVTAGRQDSTEHDCWINPVPNGGTVGSPGDGTVATANTADWEHAAAVQNSGWLPAGASGFFGMDITTPVYKGFVQPEPLSVERLVGSDHADSQLWAQTGSCDTWYSTVACDAGGASCPGGPNCAVQSLEVVAITDQSSGPKLGIFFTNDGYSKSLCWAGQGGGTTCTNCPIDPATKMASDCFVALPASLPVQPGPSSMPNQPPGASYVPGQGLTVAGSQSGGPAQYGIAPYEVEFTLWNGSSSGFPGWWVWVNGSLMGWYPPGSFNWPTNAPGPMSNGPATYLQAGGEVYDTWPGGLHTDTAMISDNAAQAGYKYAAYQRNVRYYDQAEQPHDAVFSYANPPSSEADNGIQGLCGLESAGWTDGIGAAGAYSFATISVPSGGPNWGSYMYFGGGKLSAEQTPPAPPAPSPVEIRYNQYGACNSVPGQSTGANGAYVIFRLEAIENLGGNGIPFAFDPSRLFVTDRTGAKDFANPNLKIYPAIFGPFAAVPETIPVLTNDQFGDELDVGLQVTTQNADGPIEAGQTAYTLQYNPQPNDPPVTLVKTDPSQTSFVGVDDCTKIGLTASVPGF